MTDEQLSERRADPSLPPPGSLWRHYEGGYYRVVCRAALGHPDNVLVVYTSEATGLTWARPLAEWLGGVRLTPASALLVYRFTRIEETHDGD